MTREMGGAISNAGLGYAIPLVVREDDSLLRIESELPGVGRDRIQISVADRTLFIRLFASDVTGAEFDPGKASNAGVVYRSGQHTGCVCRRLIAGRV